MKLLDAVFLMALYNILKIAVLPNVAALIWFLYVILETLPFYRHYSLFLVSCLFLVITLEIFKAALHVPHFIMCNLLMH